MRITETPTLPCIQSPVKKSNPKPSQTQEEEHERESKRKPRAKVNQITVWEIAAKDKMMLIKQGFLTVAKFSFEILKKKDLFSCPIRMRFGAVPVSVAVPPILAA